MTDKQFAASAHVYDLLYRAAGKDHEREASELHDVIQSRRPGASTLLDVACGTGAHLQHLARNYDVAGVDLEPAMLDVARTHVPEAPFTSANMRTFRLGHEFDAITCLFSAIGYMRSTTELNEAIANMARHLSPSGVLIVDGWIRRQSWHDPGAVQVLSGNENGIAAARVTRSFRNGNRTTLELHHLIGSTAGVDYVLETHELTLFSDDEYQDAFDRADLRASVVAGPHPDRDRYIAVSTP